MATAPKLQVLYRRVGDILFGWNPLPATDAAYFNIYASATSGGTYRLVKSNIANQADKTVYRTKVVVYVTDAAAAIPPNKDYFFKLTVVDRLGTESPLTNSDPVEVYPAGVEWFWENEHEDKNNHNFAWVESRNRWEKVQLTDDGKLITDAEVNIGDITLGNVKVAARADNTTLEYLLVRDDRALIVKPLDEFTTVTAYDNDIISTGVETVILSHNEGTQFYLTKVICSGTADARYALKIGSTTISAERSSWNNRNVKFEFGRKGLDIGAGSVVNVTALHSEPVDQAYEISLFGYKL